MRFFSTRRRAVWIGLGATFLCLPLLASGLVQGEPQPGVAPRKATAEELAAHTRVFAQAGDWALSNPQLTAVIRKRDGWLTDLWRRPMILPSVPALGVDTQVDALWQLNQVASVGKKDYPFSAKSTRALTDGVEVTGELELNGRMLRAITVFRVDPKQPKLTIETRYSAKDGAAVGARLGDSFKWGNVQYYVAGLGKPRMKYKGAAKWIGRKGAQGDLLLRPLAGTNMSLDYGARIRGFQGTIKAHYFKELGAGKELVARRELSFEPLPVDPPSPTPTGRLEFNLVDEQGQAIAGKLTIDRVGSKQRVFDEDGGLDGADRFAWTGNGHLTIPLPVGRYKVLATAGLERDARSYDVNIKLGETTRFHTELPRVLKTPSWTSADFHLHQVPSVDADISLPARVVSIAAEGVEIAVATDHYVVTDLGPTREALLKQGVLTTDFQTVTGCEVSTLGNRFGHFNVFPLTLDKNVAYQGTTPGGLFASARKASPHGILQVNHPRWDPAISYFSAYDVSETDGAPGRAGYDGDFDTIEVYNGDDARDLKRVKPVLLDWLHQLGRGKRYVATGSSDSHKLGILDPGLPRTFVRCRDAKTDAEDAKAPFDQCLKALKQGKAQITSGPFIDAKVLGKGPGETARIKGKSFELELTVQAAPWIDVSQLEVLAGAEGKRIHFQTFKQTRGSVERFRGKLTLSLPKGSSFIVVVAQGSRGLPNVSREYTVPFGFTNPIWIKSGG
ncbi:MAG: CehA/McbA family metallohydrolase [Myxococcales bacterium]|nr:CehA/McbA family metallohydrolase [Myxococcales bacterium]